MERFLFKNRVLKSGTYNHPIYIVIGKSAAIIEGGALPALPALWETIQDIPRTIPIKHWILLHVHYDHCGLVPFLRDRLVDCSITASAEADKAMQNKKYQSFIRIKNLELYNKDEPKGFSQKSFEIDTIVSGGDVINLGDDIELEFIETSGHSPCSMSIWINKTRSLFVSDAMGSILSQSNIFPLFFNSLFVYMENLSLFETFNPEWIFPGHYKPLNMKHNPDLFLSLHSQLQSFINICRTLDIEVGKKMATELIFQQYYHKASGFITEKIFRGSINRMYEIIMEKKCQQSKL